MAETTLVTGTATMAGLNVNREVTVPNTGTEDFARFIEVFDNPTGSPITVPARIVGNLGSNGATTVVTTSDGDALVETTDRWVLTDDADGSGAPATVHLIHGPAGDTPTSLNVVGDNLEAIYSLTVPAGETARLAHFTILSETRAGAVAAANALAFLNGFGGQADAFLKPERTGFDCQLRVPVGRA